MKAIVCTKYGPPEVLQLREVEKPYPKDNEVLIKVYATTVNRTDSALRKAEPFISRFFTGLIRPKKTILGTEFAGKIVAVGKDVKLFKEGDQVFGTDGNGLGAYAEYKCLPEEGVLAIKPANMTFEEAAAVPQAALLALQGLRYKRQIQPGQKVLINGAGGGAGTFAVQIAKSFAAEVTGVDSTIKLDIMRSIGADQVIDYTQEDFTKNGQHYNLILDFAAYHSIFDYKRSLSTKGIYVIVGGSSARFFQTVFLGPLISMTGKKMGILLHKPNKDLANMIELFEAGKVKPIIDRRYPLSEVAEAFRYFGAGHARGKVVITVEHNNKT